MKKILVVLVAVIILIAVGWYMKDDATARTYYQGYVQIEPIVIETIIERLEKVGCTEQGTTCHYVFDKEKNTLFVNRYGKGNISFGPAGGFRIFDNKLYAALVLPGRFSSKRFETAVRAEIKKFGDPVAPVEGTWTITETGDQTGVIY